jgi:hypothetical protein
LPCLETLSINYEDNNRIYGGSPFGNIFHSAPRLHSIEVRGTRTDPLLMDLPWSQLIRFSSDMYLSVNSCHRLLTRLPKLRSGTLRICLPSNVSPLKRLSLSDLERFDLSVVSGMGDLVASLVLPALRFLWIDCHTFEWSHAKFLAFITPFSSNLHTLQLFRPPTSEANIIQCLSCMPALVVVVLQDHSDFGFIRDHLLDMLTYGGHRNQCLCTRLETLRIGSVFACQDRPIADMVKSRWRFGYVSYDDRTSCSRIRSQLPGNRCSHCTHKPLGLRFPEIGRSRA